MQFVKFRKLKLCNNAGTPLLEIRCVLILDILYLRLLPRVAEGWVDPFLSGKTAIFTFRPDCDRSHIRKLRMRADLVGKNRSQTWNQYE